MTEERASWSQSGLHILGELVEDGTTFNVTAHYNIRGRLDIERLLRAFARTLARHEAFRASFVAAPVNSELLQAVTDGNSHNVLTNLEATELNAQRIFAALSKYIGT